MNTKQVTKKIKSVSNVKKITKAMQLVSAVKMRKAQQVALEGKPYQEFLRQAVERLASGLSNKDSALLNESKTSKRSLVIVFTAQKGLCGSFNMNVMRFLTKQVALGETDFITIGKKGAEILTQLHAKILADFSGLGDSDSISAVFDLALAEYTKGTYKSVNVAYNKFVNTLRSDPTFEKVLPFSADQMGKRQGELKAEEENYTVEPNSSEIVDALLTSYIESSLRFALLQSYAGEHSARMIAMKNATDNATDVILNLTSLKNKLRQQSITNELLDMVTATISVEVN
jgi:F-type H+-transporting ATPase subunit gamma